ncbi:MAG: ABC transporter ATP-binding protein [Eubacteriales bacterium]|nr:ABC transporter ATP-binding protein [Eubacteriales bacterium]
MNNKPKKKRSAVSWLMELAKPRKWEYLLSVLAALAGVACGLVPYLIMIELIGALVGGTADEAWCLNRCLIMGLWWVLRYVLHATSTTMSHHATFHVLADIRMKLMHKLATMPLGAVLDKSSGSYKNIIVERVDSIETTLAHIVPEMTSNIVGAIAVMVLLFRVDWRMGLAMLIVVPLGVLCFLSMFNGYEAKFQRTINSTKILNDTAVEYINGIEVIKAFGQSKTSYAKFVSAAKEGADCFIEWMRSCLFGQSAGMAIFPSTLIGILPIGCLLFMHGTLTAETFISVIVLSFGVMQPLITAYSYTDDLAQLGTIIGEVADILDREDLHRPETARVLPKDNSIELKGIHFSYHEKEVLHGVNLRIEPGTVNALVGPSGSGKSTIARLIASLWDVDDGSITLGGVDIRTLPLKKCTDRIAYVSQDNYLFDLSVMDNIRMGRKGATDEEIITAAKNCGCHDFIMSLENGYQTICGSSGGHLSGGERQRISIARAMLKDAPVIILDEATSYTDPENEAVIQSALAQLIRGKTLLVIAHRLSTVADADCIFVVKDGNIAAQGIHSELLESCPLYEEMWNAHMSVKDNDGEVA